MRPKAAMLFAFLAVSWSTLLLATPPPLPAPSVPCCGAVEDGKVKKDNGKGGPKKVANSYWVCPIYWYAHWGTYCSYYSKTCPEPSEYVNLDANCGLGTNWDCATAGDPPCIQFGGGPDPLNKKKGPPMHAKGNPRKGRPKKEHPSYNPGVPEDVMIAKRHYAKFQYAPGNNYCYLMLYRIVTTKTTFKGHPIPPQVFFHGVEVEQDDTKMPEFVIPNKAILSIDSDKHVCVLQEDNAKWQVVVHEKTEIRK